MLSTALDEAVPEPAAPEEGPVTRLKGEEKVGALEEMDEPLGEAAIVEPEVEGIHEALGRRSAQVDRHPTFGAGLVVPDVIVAKEELPN